jgi:chromosome segregation ATPase
MFRKIAISSIAGLLIASVVTAIPASAAAKISNGVPCTKSGATSKTSNGTYKCAKNPIVKNSKLTWLSSDCITTANTYTKALANLPKIKTSTDATVAQLDVEIAATEKSMADAALDIPKFQTELDKAKAALAVVQADAANLAKNKATIDKWKEAIKAWEKAIAGSGATTYQRALTRQQTYRGQALAQYTNAQRDVKDGLAMTQLICSKGY